MTDERADRGESGDPADPKISSSKTVRFIVKLLALAGMALVSYFLIIEGWLQRMIGLVLLVTWILSLPVQGLHGFESMLMSSALMAVIMVSELYLTFGILDVAIRRIARLPFPSRISFLRFCLIFLTLFGATVFAVGFLARLMGA